MKIESFVSLSIPDIKVLSFARFCDHRGYFTESFRKNDFEKLPGHIGDWKIVQVNESYSKKGTIRGLHFQWNPYMGKMVRTILGHMIDIILDIRIGSPTFGKVIAYDMPAMPERNVGEWIWVPPGFAHGNFFLEDTIIEYFCSGEYSQGCEAGISPLAEDIDWSLCDKKIKEKFEEFTTNPSLLITDKDRNGYSMKKWIENYNSKNFIYNQLKESQ